MQLDQSQDYLSWDHTEPVTYRSTRHGDMVDTLPTVLRAELTQRELASSGGVYTRLDLAFLIPAAVLSPGFVPKPADLITDASGTAYTVLQVVGQQRDATGFLVYKCICRDPIIVHDLQDVIAIERATISYDASGAIVKTFPPAGGSLVANRLACRVQEIRQETVDERLIHGVEGSHLVYLAREVSVNVAEDRIRWAERGTQVIRYLDLVKYYNAQKIDELPVIEARLRP